MSRRELSLIITEGEGRSSNGTGTGTVLLPSTGGVWTRRGDDNETDGKENGFWIFVSTVSLIPQAKHLPQPPQQQQPPP